MKIKRLFSVMLLQTDASSLNRFNATLTAICIFLTAAHLKCIDICVIKIKQ